MMRMGMCGWTCNKSDHAGGDLNMLVENVSVSRGDGTSVVNRNEFYFGGRDGQGGHVSRETSCLNKDQKTL